MFTDNAQEAKSKCQHILSYIYKSQGHRVLGIWPYFIHSLKDNIYRRLNVQNNPHDTIISDIKQHISRMVIFQPRTIPQFVIKVTFCLIPYVISRFQSMCAGERGSWPCSFQSLIFINLCVNVSIYQDKVKNDQLHLQTFLFCCND